MRADPNNKHLGFNQTELSVIHHLCTCWHKLTTNIRFIEWYTREEFHKLNSTIDKDDHQYFRLNQLCANKLLEKVMPLTHLAIVIRLLSFLMNTKLSDDKQQWNGWSVGDHQEIYQKLQQLLPVEPLIKLERRMDLDTKNAFIVHYLTDIIAEYISLDSYNLYNIIDYINRLEV